MGFKGFSFLLFSEHIGGYKKVNLGFVWDILETLEKRRVWRSRGFAEFSGLFFPYLYVLIQYGYVFLLYELSFVSRVEM